MSNWAGFGNEDSFGWMSDSARSRFESWAKDRDEVKTKIRSQNHSSFWVPRHRVDRGEDTDLDRIIRLSQLHRATANFVRILTGDSSIRVVYSGGQQSYTDGKTVVISADSNPDNLDVIVGLALHEGSHCLLTPLEQIKHRLDRQSFKNLSPVDELCQWLTNKAKQNTVDREVVKANLFDIINIIEDRRIDTWVYTNAPGYRGYYEKLYDRYWNSDIIESKLVRSWRSPDWESYISRLINLSNPYAKITKNVLPGISEIYDVVDIDNISRWDELNMEDLADALITTSVKVFKLMVTYILAQKVANPMNGAKTIDPADADNRVESLEDMLSDLDGDFGDVLQEMMDREKRSDKNKMDNIYDDMDYNSSGGSPVDDVEEDDEINTENPAVQWGSQPQVGFNIESEETKNQLEFARDHKEDDKRTIRREDEDILTAIQESDTKVFEFENDAPSGVDGVGGHRIKTVWVRNVTKKTLRSGAFKNFGLSKDPIHQNEKNFAAGRRWGARMVQQLLVRNEENTTKFSRRSKGKIDRKLLAGLGYQNERVFFQDYRASYRDTFIHLSIDTSSSMYGSKWDQTFKMAVALGYAATKIDNLHVVITTRNFADMPGIFTVFDSRRHKVIHLKNLCHFYPAGTTPESLCFEPIYKEMESVDNNYNKYFINICDGQPWCSGKTGWTYSGEFAEKHARKMYHMFRDSGINVWSFFISNDDPSGFLNGKSRSAHDWEAFRRMYSPSCDYVIPNNVKKIIKNLNKLLISDDQLVSR
ncbi:MAG: hypothetical protein VW683_10375 [Betaproteobacteria bacterium]